MIGSAACGSSSITVRPSGPAPASANTSIRSTRALARTGSDEITAFSSSWKDRVPSTLAAEMPTVRIVDRRIPVGALNLAWHRLRWPPIEALAGGEYDIAHSPHPLLLPSRSAAQVVTIHDLHFLTHPERTSARDSPRLPRARSRARPPRRSHHRRRRDSWPAKCSGCSTFRQSAFPSARTARPSGRDPPRARTPDGYLLFIGTIEPRKNVGGLLDAYARLLARARRRAAPRDRRPRGT